MRRGDTIHFLSQREHPTLLALLWQYGAPVVALSLGIVALALWRGSIRLGPLAAPPDTARRSLGEQIRGTGRFARRFGGGAALHAAALRALTEAARSHVSNYEHLSSQEKIARLAQLAGLQPEALADASNFTGRRRATELRNAVMLLEETRRKISIQKKKVRHANGIQHDYAGG